MIRNWKTTSFGVLGLLALGYKTWQTRTLDIDELWGVILGLGLLVAKDHDVTGGSVGP